MQRPTAELSEPMEDGKEGQIEGARGVRYTRRISQAALRCSNWSSDLEACMRSVSGPLHAFCGCLGWGFCGTPNNGSGDISDSFACSWDPFPPTQSPCPALVWEFVPRLSASCYAVMLSLRGLLFSEVKQRSSGSGLGGESDKRGAWDAEEGNKKKKERKKRWLVLIPSPRPLSVTCTETVFG